MSKQSVQKQLSPPHKETPSAVYQQSYHQPYVPAPYVPQAYASSVQIQQPLIIPQLPIQQQIIHEPYQRRVIQGDIVSGGVYNYNKSCCDGCAGDNKAVTTKQVTYRAAPVSVPVEPDYMRKLDEIERLHREEVKEVQQRMQQQIDSIIQQRNAEDQSRQMSELKSTINELKSSRAPSQYDYGSEKLEKKLALKSGKLKNLKVQLQTLQGELTHKNQLLNEYELRLQHSEALLRLPPKEIHVPVNVPVNQGPPQELIGRLQGLEREREVLLVIIQDLIIELNSLRNELSRVNTLNGSQGDWNRMVSDFRSIETENIKLNTIIGQKNELIKSLEQRLSIELSRQSYMLSQSSPQRVVIEQTTRPIQTQYVYQQQPQPQPQQQQQYMVTEHKHAPIQQIPQQQAQTHYIITEQQPVVQPTLQSQAKQL